MDVEPRQAAARTLYEGQACYFCARTCQELFDKDPARFLRPFQPLSAYAHWLYEALSILSRVFYGPVAHAGLGKSLTEAEWGAIRALGGRGECRACASWRKPAMRPSAP